MANHHRHRPRHLGALGGATSYARSKLDSLSDQSSFNSYQRNKKRKQASCRILGSKQLLCLAAWIFVLPVGFLVWLNTSVLMIRTKQTDNIKKKSAELLSPARIPRSESRREDLANGRDTNTLAIHEPEMTSNQQAIDTDTAVLTFYQQPVSVPQHASARHLKRTRFPETTCRGNYLQHFPVDTCPTEDPFLPWIHDYFVRFDETEQSSVVQFVAQNRRRCETGEGKETIMKYWEPQIALFQSIPVAQHVTVKNDTTAFKHKGYSLVSPEDAKVTETRFVCRFHTNNANEYITFSKFNIPYEYVNWRKHKGKPMFRREGTDVHQFEFSQLLFQCPVPRELVVGADGTARLDLIPIRTPPRHDQWLLTPKHVGLEHFKDLKFFNVTRELGSNRVLPAWHDSGRIANLPLCFPKDGKTKSLASVTRSNTDKPSKPHNLVLCTWTASSYNRRGDATVIEDSQERLREWIVFHKIAGVDHIYIYDNTQIEKNDDESPFQAIAQNFPDFVTYIPWPYKVCSNNRPNHKNPGERSSQYAAEASCRERFGPSTEWMSFIDTDEYLVPMQSNSTWRDVLHDYARNFPNHHVLKFRSSRGRPRQALLQEVEDQSSCRPQSRRKPRYALDPCVTRRSNETFLRTYNCEYIKPPKPNRFARAMKQIYRPSFVLSHFVHYSTITTAIARYYQDFEQTNESSKFKRQVQDHEWGDVFFDELNRGTLVHTKTVLPHETMSRTEACQTGSKHVCPVGYECPESTIFNDTIHTKNLFVNDRQEFCNCWINDHVERYWVPRLAEALRERGGRAR